MPGCTNSAIREGTIGPFFFYESGFGMISMRPSKSLSNACHTQHVRRCRYFQSGTVQYPPRPQASHPARVAQERGRGTGGAINRLSRIGDVDDIPQPIGKLLGCESHALAVAVKRTSWNSRPSPADLGVWSHQQRDGSIKHGHLS
jgi:hypothetical protein